MLIVVPARGGSSRVPRKNIALLGGRPLLVHTLDQVRKAGLEQDVVISTEDAEIAEVARRWGAGVVERPAEFASDAASTESVLLHVLAVQAKAGISHEWIMTLPPTSPFRSAATIRLFHERALAAPSHIDCLMSVTENRGDFWRSLPEGRMQRLFPNAPRRQQDREPLFEENSAVYVTRTEALRQTGSILGRCVDGVPIPQTEAFDINTLEDMALAQLIATRLADS